MAAIKAVMYVFKFFFIILELNIVVTYNMSFHRNSICLHFKFGKGQTEVISHVRLSLKI